jgi:carotenoid cleavage dioxygenase
MHRRDFLGLGARLGAAALGLSATLPLRPALAAGRTATDAPWWTRGNFSPVAEELSLRTLPVEGAIPEELAGLYVRNGSNMRAGASPHWFIGDGMLHGIRLEGGEARWYRNRLVQTSLLEQDATLGSGGPPGLDDGYANVSVFRHAGRLLASGEIGLPWEVSERDLSTLGVFDFSGALRTSMTAHPKVDPATGRLHFFGYGFAEPYLTYHVADADGVLVQSEGIEVGRPSMIHDFAITDTDAVFWELPVTFDVAALDTGIPFRWHPEHGARIGVMPLGGPTSKIRWVEIEPCYVFHGINAHRDGTDVVVDVCRHERMFDPGVTDSGSLTLRRWRIDTGGPSLTFSDEVLEDHAPGELPTRDPRRVGRPYRYGYLLDSDEDAGGEPHFHGVVKHDFQRDRREVWRPPRSQGAGEFLFVPTGRAEDDGYLLSYVHDARSDTSDLVILDARDVAAGPLARVRLPTRVPHGFHATWVPDD